MTIGGWIFFILAGGAITALMVFCYSKVLKNDTADKDTEELYNQ